MALFYAFIFCTFHAEFTHCFEHLADLTVSKRPGTCYQLEIHFAVFNHLYLLFSFVNLVDTCNCLS